MIGYTELQLSVCFPGQLDMAHFEFSQESLGRGSSVRYPRLCSILCWLHSHLGYFSADPPHEGKAQKRQQREINCWQTGLSVFANWPWAVPPLSTGCEQEADLAASSQSLPVRHRSKHCPLPGLGSTALLPYWTRSHQTELGGSSSLASPAADTWLQHCWCLPRETSEGSIRPNGKPISEPSVCGGGGKKVKEQHFLI